MIPIRVSTLFSPRVRQTIMARQRLRGTKDQISLSAVCSLWLARIFLFPQVLSSTCCETAVEGIRPEVFFGVIFRGISGCVRR